MANCPYCNYEFDCREAWRNTNHMTTEFRYVCGECDRIMIIEVEMAPRFRTSLPKCYLCEVQIDGNGFYCDECNKKLRRLES